MLKQFTIDEDFICYVEDRVEHDFIKDRNNPTPEELIKVLKGYQKIISFGNKDHPEFTKLRNKLEELGYIECQRSWINGDVVLKPFKLNEWTFRKGHKFACADALQAHIKFSRENGYKELK